MDDFTIEGQGRPTASPSSTLDVPENPSERHVGFEGCGTGQHHSTLVLSDDTLRVAGDSLLAKTGPFAGGWIPISP